jgi:hypothetical protein
MNEMMTSDHFGDGTDERAVPPQRRRADQAYIADLIAVLRANPAGLRRWSVMRAMRVRAEKANREITPKFEDDVERVFRRYCAGDSVRAGMSETLVELFHRPKEKAGEVWAVIPDAAQTWLNGDHRNA